MIPYSPYAGAGARATAFPEGRGGGPGPEIRTTWLGSSSRGEASTSSRCSLGSSNKGGRGGNSGKTAASTLSSRPRRRQGYRPDKNRRPDQAPEGGSVGGEVQRAAAVFSVVCEPYNITSVSNGLPALGALGTPEGPMEDEPYLVVFSGGTAFNSVAGTVSGGYHFYVRALSDGRGRDRQAS